MRVSQATHTSFGQRTWRIDWRVCMLVVVAAAMVLRAPLLLIEPRVWAEEGVVYMAHAVAVPWYQALISPHLGYYSLFNNVVFVIATRLFVLEYVPLFTTLAALCVQLLPFMIILWSRSPLWERPRTKVIGTLVVLFTPLSGEVWLNTVNSQFWLLLTTFLILLEDMTQASARRTWLYRGILVLAGLTGVVSCFLGPLFALRAWFYRAREHWVQFMILCVCAIVQLIVVVTTANSYQGANSRIDLPDVSMLGVLMWLKTFVLPMSGVVATNQVATWLHTLIDAQRQLFTLLGTLLFPALGVVLGLLTWGRHWKSKVLIAGSYVLVAVLSITFSIGDKIHHLNAILGARYYYGPSVMLLLLMLANLYRSPRRIEAVRAVICGVLLAVSLTIGILAYRPTVEADASWPRWRAEVAKWRSNPAYELKIWPEGWTMRIPNN